MTTPHLSTDACSSCEATGYVPGTETFDPTFAPALRKVDGKVVLDFRIHQHQKHPGVEYVAEVLVPVEGGRGFLVVDGAGCATPGIALEQAIKAAYVLREPL